MKLSVCEAPPQMLHGDDDWDRLLELSRQCKPDILLLNEMPFGRWLSAGPEPDRESLLGSQNIHDHGLDHLDELSVPCVLGSRPTFEHERSVNQGFSWSAEAGLTAAHTKQFFPNEPGYYEARWFERGELRFGLVEASGMKAGFLICTDVMFLEWARFYGRSGAHLIVVPRATPTPSLQRWKTVMSAAAVISGCYVASSNRVGLAESGQEFGGRGWIIDPVGDVIAETSPENPMATATLDLALVAKAKDGYPAYVEDLPMEETNKDLTGE